MMASSLEALLYVLAGVECLGEGGAREAAAGCSARRRISASASARRRVSDTCEWACEGDGSSSHFLASLLSTSELRESMSGTTLALSCRRCRLRCVDGWGWWVVDEEPCAGRASLVSRVEGLPPCSCSDKSALDKDFRGEVGSRDSRWTGRSGWLCRRECGAGEGRGGSTDSEGSEDMASW